MDALIEEIVADLTLELGSEETFNADALTQKVKSAIREVRNARKYPISYTDEQILADMGRYYSNIRNIALFDYNQRGAEFEISHNENSVSRTWNDRDKLFGGIIPLARI